MTTLAIVDDPNIEVAVLVDTDQYTALPIVAMGPQRVQLLEEFASSPVDLGWFTREGLLEMWTTFLQGSGVIPGEVERNPAAHDDAVAPTRDGTDAEAELAEAEAANASDVPEPQPADADQDADQEAATVTVRCWNCNGTGFVAFGDGEPDQQCGVCRGTGKVDQVAA